MACKTVKQTASPVMTRLTASLLRNFWYILSCFFVILMNRTCSCFSAVTKSTLLLFKKHFHFIWMRSIGVIWTFPWDLSLLRRIGLIKVRTSSAHLKAVAICKWDDLAWLPYIGFSKCTLIRLRGIWKPFWAIGIANCSLNTACFPNNPGWTKSIKLQSSDKLFIIGLPVKMKRQSQLIRFIIRVVWQFIFLNRWPSSQTTRPQLIFIRAKKYD